MSYKLLCTHQTHSMATSFSNFIDSPMLRNAAVQSVRGPRFLTTQHVLQEQRRLQQLADAERAKHAEATRRRLVDPAALGRAKSRGDRAKAEHATSDEALAKLGG